MRTKCPVAALVGAPAANLTGRVTTSLDRPRPHGHPSGGPGAITHVVWDWNGTLFDDAQALIAATIEAFQTLELPPVTVERYRALHVQPIDAFYRRLLGPRATPDLLRRIAAAFDAAYAVRRSGLLLDGDALAALTETAARGLTQSILSMHPHHRLAELLDHFGIRDRFARVDGQRGPDIGRKSTLLKAHLEHLNLKGGQVLLIGDTVDDARAAREAGAHCVLYASGLHDPAVLAGEGVPVVASLHEGLAAVLPSPDKP